MSRALSTSEVARILGLAEARVRECVRAGLCRPHRKGRSYTFSFQDVVVLRTAKTLLEKGVPMARVRRALAALGEELGEDRPLSGLRIYADHGHVAVQSEGHSWQPETGQTLLNFEVDALAQLVDDVRGAAPEKPAQGDPGREAQAEFAHALALEADDPGAAAEAYARAIELDPELVDAHVNLGRLVHDAGDPRAAAQLYERALDLCTDDPVIHFNLGLALEDTQGLAPAAAHYERAIALDPSFADAHYNLAGLCEKLGRRTDAVRHYHAYKKLTEA